MKKQILLPLLFLFACVSAQKLILELKEDLTISPPYRMGAVYMNVGNMRMGQDSEYFRHGIQDRWAHDMKFPLSTTTRIPDAFKWI